MSILHSVPPSSRRSFLIFFPFLLSSFVSLFRHLPSTSLASFPSLHQAYLLIPFTFLLPFPSYSCFHPHFLHLLLFSFSHVIRFHYSSPILFPTVLSSVFHIFVLSFSSSSSCLLSFVSLPHTSYSPLFLFLSSSILCFLFASFSCHLPLLNVSLSSLLILPSLFPHSSRLSSSLLPPSSLPSSFFSYFSPFSSSFLHPPSLPSFS